MMQVIVRKKEEERKREKKDKDTERWEIERKVSGIERKGLGK